MTQLLITFFSLLLTLLGSQTLMAGPESTATLPYKIRSPEISYNIIDGLKDKYDSKGNLVGVADNYRLDLTGQNISKLSSDGARLVNMLNGASATEKLGDSISVGQVRFDSQPSLDYWVINPAYGVRKNIAVGFAVPIIHFRNKMQILTGGVNNVDAIQNYLGPVNDDLTAGFQKLSQMAADLPGTVQSVLASRGFKPMGNVDFQTLGDIQIYTRYRYFENDSVRLAFRPYLLLPTGRSDDPDDLADIGVGGYTALGLFSTNEFNIIPKWVLSLVLQYQGHLPDHIVKRVPMSADDVLPKQDRKENVARYTGNIYDFTMSNRYLFNRTWSAGGFYEVTLKDPDGYNGERNYNYGLLSNDTNTQSHKVGAFVDFSTTDLYFDNEIPVPFILGYTFSTVVSAVNSPNQTAHIFNMRLFF